MTVPVQVARLIETFDRNIDSYRQGRYNETQLRREFIDPFFRALGWDIDNTQGHAEAYKDVIHEDAIRVGGATKAPDYCFRIGGTRKFFLEAKKPSINIKDDPAGAYQLRRYAWSAKLPLSILTDFEEFAVYDCRARPNKTDKASKARILYFPYTEYSERWDEIASIFSREAVLRGSFDKYAVSKRKQGTAEVDAAFLAEIERWRDLLAHNIALRNPDLTNRQLNYAVQITIDRIIFLRICEDRGIEPYGQLQGFVSGTEVYARLVALFRRADDRYNSGLFHFMREKDRTEGPDELTPELAIDDKPLKDILRSLYYPDSPYEFSVLPAEILGQVYEQFLGKVITLTAGHRARVEDKPEVKKAGGVYYTPSYIVDYIVEHTVGKLLEGASVKFLKTKPPRLDRLLRVLDPACGSGSFLLGAYQKLLDWYRDYYENHDPQQWATAKQPPIYQAGPQGWKLTTAERKRILLDHIYGVDIDTQAVEVTKLSLLLRVLEGEKNLVLFHNERALPDLADNIKCGNSLIGPDFYEGKQFTMFDDDERLRINAFDWHAEFPHAFKDGGFDAVIGNPPYIRVRVYKGLYPIEAHYLERHYRCATHVWDIYLLIFERAITLSNTEGYVSFIIPIQTLHQPNCESLRRLLMNHTAITQVVDLSLVKVFTGPTIKNCIITCRIAGGAKRAIQVARPSSPEALLNEDSWSFPQDIALSNPGQSLKVDLLSPKRILCDKLHARSWELWELCYSTFGMRSCAPGRGAGGKERLVTNDPTAPHAKPYLEGRDIRRYRMDPPGRFIQYLPEAMYSPRRPELFEVNKIVSQTMLSRKRLVATLDKGGYYVEQSLVCIIPNGILNNRECCATLPLEYILGVMNSTLESFYFSTHIIDYSLGGGLIHATPGSHDKLIIGKGTEAQIERMVELVCSILSLHASLSSSKTADERNTIQRQIDATDKEIDRLVYALYGLSDDEIRIVEEAT